MLSLHERLSEEQSWRLESQLSKVIGLPVSMEEMLDLQYSNNIEYLKKLFLDKNIKNRALEGEMNSLL